jgi:DnaJ-class molecular chaperone
VTQSDRAIAPADRCPTCSGAGWTWWAPETDPPQEGRWVVCRECIGTGRKDHKGRKRLQPEGPPEA